MNNPARSFGLVFAAIAFLFLAVFWAVMFPSVLNFENEWNTGGGSSLGPGPLIPFLGFGVIWTGMCVLFIIIGLSIFFRNPSSQAPGFITERGGSRLFSSKSDRYSSDSIVEPTGKLYSYTRYRGEGHGEPSPPFNRGSCPSCGEPVSKDDQFCGKCGSRL